MNEDVIDAETNENIEYDHEDLLTMYEEEIAQNPRTSLSKEWGFFINYVRDKPCFVPFRTEWTVYDEEIKIAGSIDMVYKDKATGQLKIYDWKRAKEIKRFDYKNGTNPIVGHLPNSNFWHYSLQLNIYKAILEKNYGYRVSELFLVRLHPDNENNDYQLIQCADLSNEVNELFQERKQNISRDPNYYATKTHHP
jgi:ATP-dependent exoDNAse (exonuclease V) beta subunit